MTYKKDADGNSIGQHFKRPLIKKGRPHKRKETSAGLPESAENAAPERKGGRSHGARNISFTERKKLAPFFNDPNLTYIEISEKTKRSVSTLCKEYARGLVQTVGENGEIITRYDPRVADANTNQKVKNKK